MSPSPFYKILREELPVNGSEYRENSAQRVLRLEWALVYDEYPHFNVFLMAIMMLAFFLALAGAVSGVVVAMLVGVVWLVVVALLYVVLNYARREAHRYEVFVKSEAIRYRQEMERQKRSHPADPATTEHEYVQSPVDFVEEAYRRGAMTELHYLAAQALKLEHADLDEFHRAYYRFDVVEPLQ